MEEWLYIPGDHVADADGNIHECFDVAYCNYPPNEEDIMAPGYWGWW
jgi:hypothetical protein